MSTALSQGFPFFRGGSEPLQEARAYCVRLTRRTALNFYYAFLFLKERDRHTAFAIYSYCRTADDLADDERLSVHERLSALERFEDQLETCWLGEPVGHPVFQALQPILARREVSLEPFRLLLKGMRQDLTVTRYATFRELETYCYHVAAVVALMLIPVFDPERASDLQAYAREGGTAVQLTNILRDVREDAHMGRIYLPQEDLDRFGVAESELLSDRPTEAFRDLMAYEVERARGYYEAAEAILTPRDRRRQQALEAARAIYRHLLDEIVRRRYDVLSGRLSLSGPRKLGLALGSLARGWAGR